MSNPRRCRVGAGFHDTPYRTELANRLSPEVQLKLSCGGDSLGVLCGGVGYEEP